MSLSYLGYSKYTKLFLLVFLTLFIFSFINADLGSYKQCNPVSIKTILNASWVNISTISYPNSSLSISNIDMTKIGETFNYTYLDTCTIGQYIYDYYDDRGNVYVNSFEITPTGENYSTSQSIQYIALLVIGFVLFFITLYSAIVFPWKNERDDENTIISINNLKYTKIILFVLSYLLFLFIIFIAKNMAFSFQGGIYELFNITFNILLILLIPFFPLLIAFTVIIWINDKKVQEGIVRGFNYENY